jgi:hypothetical protein
MRRELLSNATPKEFREVITGYVLRKIEITFHIGGLTPRTGFRHHDYQQQRTEKRPAS